MKKRASLFSSAPLTDLNSSEDVVPARVIDVVLNEKHPGFNDYGDIGSIRYRVLGSTADEDNKRTLGAAFPLHRNNFTFPLINEVVFLFQGPVARDKVERSDSGRVYYSTPIAIWNHPHFNAHPTPSTDGTKVKTGGDFIEVGHLAPLSPNMGDTIMEGRHGQSIRLTGTLPITSPYFVQTADEDGNIESNNGKSLVIIRSGQKEREEPDGYTPISEDINDDASSIYIAQDHVLPLSASTDLGPTFIQSKPSGSFDSELVKPPEDYNTYRGAQIVVNSNRLVFNAKNDSVLISAQEAIGLNANSINLDATTGLSEEGRESGKLKDNTREGTVVINGRKIYLGLNALRLRQADSGPSTSTINEPAVLGRTNMSILRDIIHSLYSLTAALATPNLPDTYIPYVITQAGALMSQLEAIDSTLESALSDKVFLEPNLKNRRRN